MQFTLLDFISSVNGSSRVAYNRMRSKIWNCTSQFAVENGNMVTCSFATVMSRTKSESQTV